MFYHKNCGGLIYGKIKLDFYYSVGIGKKSTSIGLGEILWDKSITTLPAEYFCVQCKKNIPIDQIEIACSFWRRNFLIQMKFLNL